ARVDCVRCHTPPGHQYYALRRVCDRSNFSFDTSTTAKIYTLSLHDALPICARPGIRSRYLPPGIRRVTPAGALRSPRQPSRAGRSEEHTSELQSLAYLVCRLLLEKKKIAKTESYRYLNRTFCSASPTDWMAT